MSRPSECSQGGGKAASSGPSAALRASRSPKKKAQKAGGKEEERGGFGRGRSGKREAGLIHLCGIEGGIEDGDVPLSAESVQPERAVRADIGKGGVERIVAARLDNFAGAYKNAGIGHGVRGAWVDDEFDGAARAKGILAIAECVAGEKLERSKRESDGDGFGGIAEGELPVRKIQEIGAAACVVGYVQVEFGRTSGSASRSEQESESCKCERAGEVPGYGY